MEPIIFYQPIYTFEYDGELKELTSMSIFDDLEDANENALEQVKEFQSNPTYSQYTISFYIQSVFYYAHSEC